MRVLDVGEIVRVDGPKGGPSKIFSSETTNETLTTTYCRYR